MMELWSIRFVLAVGLPIYLLMDKIVDQHTFYDSLAYYKYVWKKGI